MYVSQTKLVFNIILHNNIINQNRKTYKYITCLLYTSDAADDMQCVDLGGRRIIKKCCPVLCVAGRAR